MARIDTFLELCAEQRASDLHFHAGKKPVLRRHGELIRVPFRVLTGAETRRFVYEILSSEQRARLEIKEPVDMVYSLPDGTRFRVNVARQHHGLSAVFRLINREAASLEELLMPPGVRRLAHLSSGLVLITGPTGSGKSTTLTALIDSINHTRRRHILTIEDPIEFVHTPDRCLITQREVGTHVASFARALKSALREAPDVIVVGELRDAETIQLALNAAETGILVFATLHTNSAAKSISRMLDALPAEARHEARTAVSLTLRGVVSQTLCRQARGDGRLAAVEVLLHTEGVGHLIRENKTPQLEAFLRSQGPETGMQSLEAHLFRHLRANMITEEEARTQAYDRAEMELMIQRWRESRQ